MFITTFLKNRRKKYLLKRIYALKLNSVELNSSLEQIKESIDEISSDLQKQKSYIDTDTKIYRNFTKGKKLLHSCNKDYAVFYQMYLNTQDEIARLEKELDNL